MRSKCTRAAMLLAAMFALGAVAAGSASAALPEFTGSFPNQTNGSLGRVYLTQLRTTAFECKSGRPEGSITAAKKWSGRLDFTECTYAAPKFSCSTSGANAGEMRTESLEGLLVYTSKAKKEVGLDFQGLAYENKKLHKIFHEPFMGEITCKSAGVYHRIYGSAVGRLAPINVATQGFTLAFNASGGVQQPSEFENELGKMEKDQLEWEGENLGMVAGFSFNTFRALEIKA
jgi:hypothetical protein